MKMTVIILAVLAIGVVALLARKPFHIVTETVIPASTKAVWAALIEFDAYPQWNPFIVEVTGDARPQATLAVTIHAPDMSPMQFQPKVLKAVPNQELRWRGSFGISGIFDGEHYFKLFPQEDGSTRLVHGETFTGLLAPVLFPWLKQSTRAGFTSMNQALSATVQPQG